MSFNGIMLIGKCLKVARPAKGKGQQYSAILNKFKVYNLLKLGSL